MSGDIKIIVKCESCLIETWDFFNSCHPTWCNGCCTMSAVHHSSHIPQYSWFIQNLSAFAYALTLTYNYSLNPCVCQSFSEVVKTPTQWWWKQFSTEADRRAVGSNEGVVYQKEIRKTLTALWGSKGLNWGGAHTQVFIRRLSVSEWTIVVGTWKWNHNTMQMSLLASNMRANRFLRLSGFPHGLF